MLIWRRWVEVLRLKFGLIVLVFLLITTFDPYAQEKKLTADDVSKLEMVASPSHVRELAFRKTTTHLYIGGSGSPFGFLEISESSPPNSIHILRIWPIKGRLERIDYFRIGSKIYNKVADGPWIISDIETKPPVVMAERESQKQVLEHESAKKVLERVNSNKDPIDPALAAALAAAEEEDELITRSDTHAKAAPFVEPAVVPASQAETVDVKYEPDKLLDKALTNFYEVTTRGTTGSGKTLIGYTMIKRVWINKSGTLARKEFESTNTVQPRTLLVTDVYEYDSNIKIEPPIK